MKLRITTIVVTQGFANGEPRAAVRIETVYDDGSVSDLGLLKLPLFDWYYLTLVWELARRAKLADVTFVGDEILQSRMKEECQSLMKTEVPT